VDLTKGSLSARENWEEQQSWLHGCDYIDGVCVKHGSEQIALEPKLLCSCRSFAHAHELEAHDTLPGRFAGDTELRRFQDAAATDWRRLQERQLRRESARMFS
jgi:hypothetical protein